MADDPFAAIAQPETAADPFAAIAQPANPPPTSSDVDASGLPVLKSQWDATKYGLKEAGKGVVDVAKGLKDTFNPIQQPGENAFTQIPLVRMAKGAIDTVRQIPEIPGAIKDIYDSGDALHALAVAGPRAGGQAAATLAIATAPKVLSKVGELRTAVKSSIAPREVPIAGEKIPVLAGEAAPETVGGRIQAEVKRAGAGEQSFKDFSAKQQASVKQVIRNVAQQTSGAVGPMADEPGAAMSSAADATFAKARPMYTALDSSLKTIPDAMTSVSKVTEQAIARARKLGATISQSDPESIDLHGRTLTPQTDPVAWQMLKDQGIISGNSGGQPISSYMKVRSELLKMQRSTPDAALRNAIGNEITGMNSNMEAALKGTPLWDNWQEANRLWSKGYAIRDVGDAIRKSTKGTPEAEQAPGVSKVPTVIKGPQLVQRLNELKQNGVLDRAFTPDETSNLRQAADILDRASSSAGRQFGFGYGAHSTIMRNLVKLPAYPLVKVMTTPQGVAALRSGNAAAFTALVTAAGATVNNRKDALDALGKTAQ